MNQQQVINKILRQRYFFMGIAMLMVVFYHCFVAIPTLPFVSFFSRGYIGVDIFLFFSGLGLCYSFNSKPIKVFFKDRFKRILPLYWIWAIVHLFVLSFQSQEFPKIIDVFGLMTTLSYYGIGAIRSNWYLSSLLFFYLSFPLLYTSVIKWRWVALVPIAGVTAIMLHHYNFNWYHSTFVGRFYIFSFGIYFYHLQKKIRLADYVLIFSLVIIGIISLSRYKFQYWGTSCICPALIVLLSLLPNGVTKSRHIAFFGQYSLEIFVANCWTMLLMGVIHFNPIISCVIYFLSNTVFAILLIFINKRLQ